MAEISKRNKQTMVTLGYSDMTFESFLEQLRRSGIQILVDIRTLPKSKTKPQFNQEELKDRLPAYGITYHHIKELGGKGRKPLRRSPNKGLPKAWQAFADHMLSEEFERGLRRLLALVSIGKVAIFCTEARWERCHRKFLADALTVRGFRVLHFQQGSLLEHVMTPGHEIKKEKLTYPALGEQLTLFS